MILLRHSRWRGDKLVMVPEWADYQGAALRKWNWLEHERQLNPPNIPASGRRLWKPFRFRRLKR